MIHKKTFHILLGMLVLGWFADPAFADSPAPNMEHVVYSANHQFSIRMTPGPEEGWGGYGAGEGIVSRIDQEGHGEELWKVNFYAAQPMLANDGRHMIVFGPWASELSDLAVSFYEEGKLLRSYTVGDLVEDPARLERTVSHFFWRSNTGGDAASFAASGKELHLKLIDGTQYIFDINSGQILNKKHLPT